MSDRSGLSRGDRYRNERPIRTACRKSELSRHLLPITKRSFRPGSPGPQILREVVPVRSGATGTKVQ